MNFFFFLNYTPGRLYGLNIGTVMDIPSPTLSRVQGLASKTTQDRTRTKDTKTPRPFMLWNNSPLKKSHS